MKVKFFNMLLEHVELNGPAVLLSPAHDNTSTVLRPAGTFSTLTFIINKKHRGHFMSISPVRPACTV